MKVKATSLVVNLLYLPFVLFFYYKILELIHASELLWFLYWMIVPFAIVTAILGKLAEWEDD